MTESDHAQDLRNDEVSLEQAASTLLMDPARLRAWAEHGLLECRTAGAERLVSAAELRRFKDARERAGQDVSAALSVPRHDVSIHLDAQDHKELDTF